ncbi:hypothetical protein HZZ00_37325 (plasmid) [Streptomyces sp. NEAU-sy36]|uniref:hypothetical protein n=1 Tax=unclassified Streptomyces TaxID=2593676 RepID=UPI0015D6414A|nr:MULTISPECIES: hypothetical protein [unclassified Streptomyces]QLJ06695.1 hypothetical protein HZZ00_37325 [Streptomyces sp. NEAU-sy36]
MIHSLTTRQRRAHRRTLRATLRQRAAANRLVSSVRRRPRSLATVAIAAGVDKATATGTANGLRSVAKRLGVTPAQTARTRRTVNGGRAHHTHNVSRYTLGQVRTLIRSYRPRKPEYVAAVDRIARLCTAA